MTDLGILQIFIIFSAGLVLMFLLLCLSLGWLRQKYDLRRMWLITYINENISRIYISLMYMNCLLCLITLAKSS